MMIKGEIQTPEDLGDSRESSRAKIRIVRSGSDRDELAKRFG